jgi:hypothetical protein
MKEIPTFYEMKFAESSKIFESEDVMSLTPEQLNEAEQFYYKLVEKLEKKEELDEGLLGAIIGGAAGALVGPAIGKAICRILSIDENGHLGKLLTSRLVTTAMGLALGKG